MSSSKSGGEPSARGSTSSDRQKEKARLSRTSQILWHAHQNDASAVRKLLQEDRSLVNARDYDNRTPLHVASLHGWIDVATCLLEFGADVNSQDRWRNTPLADAEGAKKHKMIELLKSYGGLSYGQNGSHFEPKPVPPPLPNKCDWEVDPSELDFSNSNIIGKGSFGEILRASWRGTPVAVKRILPSLSDDRLVIQDFRHEVNLLVKLRHPNVVQFLGAVTDKKPLMLITEYLRGGDLHQYLKEKNGLNSSAAINFALDIARFVGKLVKIYVSNLTATAVFTLTAGKLTAHPNSPINKTSWISFILLMLSKLYHIRDGCLIRMLCVSLSIRIDDGQNGSHFEPKPVPPPLPNKCDWEVDPSELDFSNSNIIGKGSFGEILRASWRGTPVAVKRILPSLSDDRLVIQDFRHEVNLLVKLRHPNVVQFLGAVTDKKPLMLITEYLRGGDLHQYLKEKNGLNSSAAINFALDIARFVGKLVKIYGPCSSICDVLDI
ncbi:hypothetical protein Gotur_006655 [Gossypium turneri]